MKLPVKDDQTILGPGQFSDTDRIAPKDLDRNLSWIIARAENDDVGVREPDQQIFEIAVGRHQDEVACRGVFKDFEIASAGKAVSERALGLREQITQHFNKPRRKALVEEELHPPETLLPAANSAA